MLSQTAISQVALQQHFIQVLSILANPPSKVQAQQLWQDLLCHYQASHRHYHNLNHLQQLFAQFIHIQARLAQPITVALALFYHDIIYQPKYLDNEQQSADYFWQNMQKFCEQTQAKQVYELIMMTANHQLIDTVDNLKMDSLKNDGAYFLDMDLSILAMPDTKYDDYSQKIRQEYQHVSDKDYCQGRSAVLTHLLSFEHIYQSDYYRPCEPQARKNLQRELAKLCK